MITKTRSLSSTHEDRLVVARSLGTLLYPAMGLIVCGLLLALIEGSPLDSREVELSQIFALDSTGELLVALGLLVLACAPLAAILAVLARWVSGKQWSAARDSAVVVLLLVLAATL